MSATATYMKILINRYLEDLNDEELLMIILGLLEDSEGKNE